MDQATRPSCIVYTALGEQSSLSLSDSARLNLRDDNKLGSKTTAARKFLLAMWDSEVRRKFSPKLDVIRDAHLDKLLDEVLSSQLTSDLGSIERPLHHRIAEVLRQQWTCRYGEDYADLDSQRLMQMRQTGDLRELEFVGLNSVTPELWQATPAGIEASKTIQRTTDWSHLEASK